MGDAIAEVTVRPQVPMGAFQALGYVCVLGVVEALRALGVSFAAVGWPYAVVDSRTDAPLCACAVRAGYDRGMFCTCTVVGDRQVGLLRHIGDDELREAVQASVAARVAAWEAEVVAGHAAAGPLAPVLSDYFDSVALMGRPAEAVYPNGNTMARGTLAGMDVWGRATLVLQDGSQLDIAPEQAGIRRAD